ncbi:MAG TPA: AAA family ATPase [Lachnospiraceae bacterium]|nr:AAA family ATPase [Lachnospiraceae bacterium]
MGMFVNPDNSAFCVALNSEIYVDKTMLLAYTNKVMDTNSCFICNSRPRRFGKSITANMLTAYYSRGSDSEDLFEDKKISRCGSYREHLNRYDVIRFDLQWFLSSSKPVETIVPRIEESIIAELKEYFPQEISSAAFSLPEALAAMHKASGRKFIIIIDEWDALIRDEAENTSVQETYIDFLRSLFKGTHPTEFIHLAYLTGILPVKKLKTQSALNNFEEFTMLSPGPFAPFIGFTEEEVKELSRQYHRDFEEVKRWYDGYVFAYAAPVDETAGHADRLQVYNPMAVDQVMRRGAFESYWSKTGTYDSIVPLIGRDFDGLKTSVIAMLSGESVKVRTRTYQNDMVSFKNKDDILTALIHLGYLAYDQKDKTAFIPNEEIRSEFIDAIEDDKWDDLLKFQQKSETLLNATLNMDEKAVADIIDEIHMGCTSIIQYNDENSLSSVLAIAYLSAMQYYFKPVRELPTGRGFADFVFLPKTAYVGQLPALVVELKWNKSVKTAIRQIRDRQYTKALEHYTGTILLVGISYSKKNSAHKCLIERLDVKK